MSVVRLLDLAKRYDDKLVLRQAYVRLSPGDRLGLIDKVATRLREPEGGGAVRGIAGNWTMWQASEERRKKGSASDSQ